MQRAARLAAQALRVAPPRTRGCASDAAATLRDEGDTRLFAYVLGAFGALPFLAATPQGFQLVQDATKSFGQTLPITLDGAAKLQAWYGSSIVSFLGAPHWGLAMASAAAGTASVYANVARYAWGVTPSLLVFPVAGMNEQMASDAVFTSLSLCFAADAAFTAAKLLPRWYFWHLRVPLTLTACGSLLATSLRERKPAAPQLLPPPPAQAPAKRGWW